MWSRLILLSACLLAFGSSAWAQQLGKAEYTEQALQSAAVANGVGNPISVDRYSSIALDVTITGTATVNFEGSVAGTAATAVTCTLTSTGAATQTATATGMYQCNVAGFKGFQARISGYSSGSVTVYARASTAILGRGGSGGGAGSVTSVDATGGTETTTGSPITTTGTVRGSSLVNVQSGTTYTVLTGDRGKLVTFSNASPVAVTQPNAGGTFPAGWYVDFENRGAGLVTVTPTTATVDGAASIALAQNTGIRLFSDGTNYFTQRGSGASAGLTLGSTAVSGGAASNFLYVAAGPVLQGVSLTGAVLGNGASAPTAYAGQTCTNQFARVLSAALAITCNTVTSAFVDTSVWTGTASSGILKASSQGVLATATAGTDYAGVGTANSWVDDVKQTFNPGTNNAGINVGSQAAAPSTPANGDAYYDTTALGFQLYENGAWRGLGVASLTDTIQSVFARGKVISTANSFANRLEVGDGTSASTPGVVAIYTDATLGPQINCIVSSSENNCNYSRWLLTGKTFSFLANDRTTAIGTVTSAASSGTWTNMSLDVEATGNVIRTTSKNNFATVGCSGTTGTLMMDTNATLAPSATCTAGSTNTTLIQGYADFPDIDGDYSLQTHFRLPSDWAGAVDVQIYWKSAATTGDVVWQVATMCTADAEIEDVAWNTADAFAADTAKGTTLQLNTVTKTGITTTGCAAGELMHMKFFRNRTNGSDTIAGVVSLKNIEVTLRRDQ